MKIFEVGMEKTGTTSLGRAYEILGFRHQGWDEELYRCFQNRIWGPLFTAIDNNDAFEDLPWHNMPVSVLDTCYPDSKFIFLEREDESWLRSTETHVKSLGYDWNENTAKWKLINKQKKRAELEEYFAERENQLLIMEIQDGWEPLCAFLGVPVPDVDFPWLNKTT